MNELVAKHAVILCGSRVVSLSLRFSGGAYWGTDLLCCFRCETFCESSPCL